MNNNPFGSNSPKSFNAYRRDFDLESGTFKKPRKPKGSPFYPFKMIKSFGNRVHYFIKLHPCLVFLISLLFGASVLVILSFYQSHYQIMSDYQNFDFKTEDNQFMKLKNLVMVAGHSVYTSRTCENVNKEDGWFLEPYQKHPGHAATFLAHIQQGIEITAEDDSALLLFSGGETRKDAGPRSEAQSYWSVADSKEWFGNEERVRWRAVTEEHARDSYENLLFSVCRFKELTGAYPQNITVVSYDFKEERFAHLHRAAIGFPESRFFYSGTPTSPTSKESALKGEALVRSEFEADPYGCQGRLKRKKFGRDPFRRSIPYPKGCPEIEQLFSYCGRDAYQGSLPWSSYS